MSYYSSENEAVALLIKKTVELSKNQSTLEELAAFVISTFNLKLKSEISDPLSKTPKLKLSTEEIQNHFQRFIPSQGEKPTPYNAELSEYKDEVILPEASFPETIEIKNTAFVPTPKELNNISQFNKEIK